MVIREPEADWWAAQARRTVTLAVIRESDPGWRPELVAARLAELPAEDDLLVVFGCGTRGAGQRSLLDELRRRRPDDEPVPVHVRDCGDELLSDAAAVERLLEDGYLPVVATPEPELADVTARIASYLGVDRVLRTGIGAVLHQVWPRPAPAVC